MADDEIFSALAFAQSFWINLWFKNLQRRFHSLMSLNDAICRRRFDEWNSIAFNEHFIMLESLSQMKNVLFVKDFRRRRWRAEGGRISQGILRKQKTI